MNLKKAYIYYYGNDMQRTHDFAKGALKIAQRHNLREIECQCYILLSLIDQENALQYAEKALALAETLKLPPLIASVLHRLTQIFIQSNDRENARYYGSKALYLYDDMKSKLTDDDRTSFTKKPEYAQLLEV